jgi:NADH:ubiquinone reductase (H+-translocating)
MGDRFPRVVIVGGGFGGLATAKALRNAPVRVTLIDRSNHHLFQPLLYQVATSVLTPGRSDLPCVIFSAISAIRRSSSAR